MATRPYVSTDAPIIMVHNWQLDDAVAIQYQLMGPKEPLYGYRSELFDDVAKGKTIVHGMLDINFRFKGYLTLVLGRLATLEERIKNARRGDFDDTSESAEFRAFLRALKPENNFQDLLLDSRTISATKKADLLKSSAESFDLRRFRRLAEAMREDFWEEETTITDREGWVANYRPSAVEWPEGFNMDIIYFQNNIDDPNINQDNALVKRLIGVRFIGESQVMENRVPGGGEPLLERYQFIAKNIV